MAMPWSLPGAKTLTAPDPPGALTLQTIMVQAYVATSSGSFGNDWCNSAKVPPLMALSFQV